MPGKRGGRQPGAGRPPTIAAVRTAQVRLGAEHVDALQILRERWGYDNDSDVLRRALLEAALPPR